MSFSSEVKEELSEQIASGRHWPSGRDCSDLKSVRKDRHYRK